MFSCQQQIFSDCITCGSLVSKIYEIIKCIDYPSFNRSNHVIAYNCMVTVVQTSFVLAVSLSLYRCIILLRIPITYKLCYLDWNSCFASYVLNHFKLKWCHLIASSPTLSCFFLTLTRSELHLVFQVKTEKQVRRFNERGGCPQLLRSSLNHAP